MIILAAALENDVAPRFDLATEVRIARALGGRMGRNVRTVLLSSASAEELCGVIVRENASVVLCGGIEETHYQYLTWKKVRVIDGVIGPCDKAMEMAARGELEAGSILSDPGEEEGA